MALRSPITRLGTGSNPPANQPATPPAAPEGGGTGSNQPAKPATRTPEQQYNAVCGKLGKDEAISAEQLLAARDYADDLEGAARDTALANINKAQLQLAARRERVRSEAVKSIYDTANEGIKTALSAYNTSADKKKDEFYNKIIYESFEVGKGQRALDGNKTLGSKEICSIIDNYSWTNDSFTPAALSVNGQLMTSSAPIPHCYLVEYQQMHSSNITNFVNTLAAAANAITDSSTYNAFNTVQDKVKTLWSALKAMEWSADEGTQQLQPKLGLGGGDDKPKETPMPSQFYTNILSNMAKLSGGIWKELSGANGIQNAIMNSPHLAPYKLLYSLNPTDQRFVFPMLAQPPINKVMNEFGDKQDEGSLLSNLSPINWISKVSTGVVNFVRDFKDLSHLFGGGNSETYQLSHVEKAKFFNYPQQTLEYTITFPLLNTVKANGTVPNWKKNYKFIFLFSLRNMIYRRDNASFFPPLFYDLIIPGVIRQPFCYVKDISVKPLGVVRMLSYENLTSFTDGKKYSVAVPLAWLVTIKLKSLLATTSNMVLSSLTDLSINAEVKQVSA